MIPVYSRKYVRDYLCGPRYYLPFEASEEDVFQKTIELFSEARIYARDLYTEKWTAPAVTHKENTIHVKCLYEGYDTYYRFTIVVEVFQLKAEKKTDDNMYTIALNMEHEYGGLLDQLLDIRVVPELLSNLKLKEYEYL